jgi:hypothetical protein
MNGAREFCKLFHQAEQHERLYLLPHHHARGKTFRIFVLPAGEKVIENGGFNPPLNHEAIEVYGIVGGNPGWTEYYGWIHEGPWQGDFYMICDRRRKEIRLLEQQQDSYRKAKADEEKKRIADLLGSY